MADRPSFYPFRKLAVLGLVLAIPGIALGAQVKGEADWLEKLMNPVWSEAKDGTPSLHLARTVADRASDLRNLAAFLPKELCVAAIASTAQQAPAIPYLITVGGGRTTPVTVVVAPGTRLHFENRDPFPHNSSVSVSRRSRPGRCPRWRPRLDGAGARQIRNSRRALAERSQLGRRRSERRRDRVPGSEAFHHPAACPGEYTVRAFFSGARWGAEEFRARRGQRRHPMVVNEGAAGRSRRPRRSEKDKE